MGTRQILNGPVDPFPSQVPLFKSTQYFANVLDLASIVVALIYEQLPSQSFKLRTGGVVKLLTGLSELSIATTWNSQYSDWLANPSVKPSLFWQTISDFIQTHTHDATKTAFTVGKIQTYLNAVVQDAHGDTTYSVFLQLQLKILNDYLPENSALRPLLTFDDLLKLLNFLYSFRVTLAEVLFYEIPKLSFQYPLDDKPKGWNLDVDAVIDLQLPATPEKFLTWSVHEKGVSMYLHFDSIALDDASGLAVVNRSNNGDGQTRFPFGGTAGALTLSNVMIALNVNGELAKADQATVAPYHRLRDAFFTERDHDNIVDTQLTVGDVNLGLNHTLLSAVYSVVGWLDNDVSKQRLEDIIHDGFEASNDFGDIGDTISDAVLTPLLPEAVALETHDFFRPFTNEHTAFSYDKLYIKGSDRGIYILNDAPQPDGGSNGDTGPHYPPTDGVPDPPIYDHADPLPASAVTMGSPFDFLIPTAARRASMKSKLDAMSNLPPEQEAAARLWLDGFSPKSMCWLQDQDIDRKGGTIYSKPASPKTIASLDRLIANSGPRRSSFLFASASVRPAAGAMLATASAPFSNSDEDGVDLHPVPDPLPVHYALESTLASSKGSAVDPFWAGISINAVAIRKVCLMLNDSDAFVQSGTIGLDLPYAIEPKASPSIQIDLSGKEDSRPIARISGLVVRFGDPVQATYLLECSSPLEVIKQEPGCLPDDTLSTVAFNRSCIESMTGGKFTDQSYLDLLYRYFYSLQFVSGEALVTQSTLTHGSPILQPPTDSGGEPGGPPDPAGNLPDPPAIPLGDTILLTEAVRSILSQVLPVPAVFDPYYAQKTTLRNFEAKDGWLNVYETYQGLSL